MADMLVNLLKLPPKDDLILKLKKEGIQIRRPLPPDKIRIVNWVLENRSMNAASECDVCFAHTPVSCYIATRGAQILGYGCYNATAPDFFGPTFVLPEERGKGIGKALLLSCLHAMREMGYAYAIIGWADEAAPFYEKTVNAMAIPDSHPAIYQNLIRK